MPLPLHRHPPQAHPQHEPVAARTQANADTGDPGAVAQHDRGRFRSGGGGQQSAYSHAWTLGNFKDALKAGYVAHRLVAGEHLVGYFVAMQVIDEVHLLNITVAPPF